MLQHDRTLDHYGTEDDTTTVLVAPIGRYPTGMTVHDVLADLAARLTFVEAVDCGTHILAWTNDGVLRKTISPSVSANSLIRDPSKEFIGRAVIFKTQSPAFLANAVLVQNVNC